MNREDQIFLQEKAKTKKDGVWKAKGVSYRVKNGNLTHIATSSQVLQCCGAFNVLLGEISYMENPNSVLKELNMRLNNE